MSKKDVIKKVEDYAARISKKLNVKMVILQQAYPGELDKPNCEIEVVVVINFLKEDQDYILIRGELEDIARQVDPNMDPVLVEEEKKDLTGFYKEIRKTGEVITNNTIY